MLNRQLNEARSRSMALGLELNNEQKLHAQDVATLTAQGKNDLSDLEQRLEARSKGSAVQMELDSCKKLLTSVHQELGAVMVREAAAVGRATAAEERIKALEAQASTDAALTNKIGRAHV